MYTRFTCGFKIRLRPSVATFPGRYSAVHNISYHLKALPRPEQRNSRLYKLSVPDFYLCDGRNVLRMEY